MRKKNKLVRCAHTRSARWIPRDLLAEEYNKMRVNSRRFFNINRHTALALGKIFEEDNIMDPNEAEMLVKQHD